jgi:hypothetical protein
MSASRRLAGANGQRGKHYDAANPPAFERHRTAATTHTDLSLSTRFEPPAWGAEALKVPVNVFNLMSKQDVTSIGPARMLAGDPYIFQAPRSAQRSAKAEF